MKEVHVKSKEEFNTIKNYNIGLKVGRDTLKVEIKRNLCVK